VSRKPDALDDGVGELIAEFDGMNQDVLEVIGHSLVLDGGSLAYVGDTLRFAYRPFAENPLAHIRLRYWCQTTARKGEADELVARLAKAEPPWPALGRALAVAVEVAAELHGAAA
jgi:hypothetical protein